MRGRTILLLLLLVFFLFLFFLHFFWFGSWECARDALPLITTCNQIVSKFLNYGSSLLRLNGFFVDWDDNSCGGWDKRWVSQLARRLRLLSSLTLLRLHTVNANFAQFRTDDAICSREVNVPLTAESHAARCQIIRFVESLY